MASYMIRNLDPVLWNAARDRAKAEGHNLKWVILQLIAYYVRAGLPR
jgi:hypothetical protein